MPLTDAQNQAFKIAVEDAVQRVEDKAQFVRMSKTLAEPSGWGSDGVVRILAELLYERHRGRS